MSRILVVDDEPTCRGPLAKLLELEGFEADTAEDGLQAMERIEQRPPDLIVLDLLMPRMDGVQFLEELRKDRKWSSTPILLVTGQHDSKLQARAMALGVQEYLFKAATPFTRLLNMIYKHLGTRPEPVPAPAKPRVAPEPHPDAPEDDDASADEPRVAVTPNNGAAARRNGLGSAARSGIGGRLRHRSGVKGERIGEKPERAEKGTRQRAKH
jgi:CheY-like chemotaxis protein